MTEASSQSSSQPGKILVCEDESLVAVDLQRTLEEYGFHVAGVADNGPDALTIAKHTRPDLAIMDIGLRGGMNGIEVASSLRRSYDIPCVFLTSNTDADVFSAAKSTDPYGFLTKPIDADLLRRTLDLAFNLRQKEQTLKAEVKANAEQVDVLMQRFPVAYDEEGRNFFGSMLRIAGGISHHLNNMLFVVQGNLEWLSSCKTVAQYEKRYINAALNTCERAADFIKKLGWASGRGKFEVKVASVTDIINQAIAELKPNLQCTVDLSGQDYKVFVEERMIIEAVKALILNADEASTRGQTIEINLFEIDADQFHAPDREKTMRCVAIEIKDNGKGFSAKMAESLVEPFVSSHTLDRFGLGLSVARGVCFAHDGWLTVSSSEGMGATARMFLPLGDDRSQVDA